MATFLDFSSILPDPYSAINLAGATDAAGTYGAGFAGVAFRNTDNVQVNIARSGSQTAATNGYQLWTFDIAYNDLLREEIDTINGFLFSIGGGKLKPFFVVLPQYARPRDDTFATFCTTNTINTVTASAANSSTLLLNTASKVTTGNPSPGDMISISDSSNSRHTKVYMITRCETNAKYKSGSTQPSATQRRIHVYPNLIYSVSAGATINFIKPKFKVRTGSSGMDYELNTEGYYSSSGLKLQESI